MVDGENIAFSSFKIIKTHTCLLQRKSKILTYAHPLEPHGKFPFRQAWREERRANNPTVQPSWKTWRRSILRHIRRNSLHRSHPPLAKWTRNKRPCWISQRGATWFKHRLVSVGKYPFASRSSPHKTEAAVRGPLRMRPKARFGKQMVLRWSSILAHRAQAGPKTRTANPMVS
mgnify:CR=1 FL=1